MNTPLAPMTIQVKRSALGDGPELPIVTLNQASAAYRAFLDSGGLGSSEAGCCLIRQAGKVVAHVSYNGKVWAGTERDWKAGTEPLFVP